MTGDTDEIICVSSNNYQFTVLSGCPVACRELIIDGMCSGIVIIILIGNRKCETPYLCSDFGGFRLFQNTALRSPTAKFESPPCPAQMQHVLSSWISCLTACSWQVNTLHEIIENQQREEARKRLRHAAVFSAAGPGEKFSVFQALQRGRDAAAAADHLGRGLSAHAHHRSASQQAAEV